MSIPLCFRHLKVWSPKQLSKPSTSFQFALACRRADASPSGPTSSRSSSNGAASGMCPHPRPIHFETRTTHPCFFLEGGRHQVIRDFWQGARANRDVEGSWHGAVVFAPNEHVVVGTGSTASIPMAADETTRQAFPQCSQSSSSQPASSSNWANTARREFSRGVKRVDFPSSSVSSLKYFITMFSFMFSTTPTRRCSDHPDSHFIMLIFATASGPAAHCSSLHSCAGASGSYSYRV